MAFDLENCWGATAGGPERGTTPRIRPRCGLGLAALPLDAVTARSSAANASRVIERPANLVIPRTECPREFTLALAQSGQPDFSALASRLSLRRVVSNDPTELPSVPASPCSRDTCCARYAVWLATYPGSSWPAGVVVREVSSVFSSPAMRVA